MIFCPVCGRLMTSQGGGGYKCFCGAFADENGNQIDVFAARAKATASEKKKKRKSFRYKYPNMSDETGSAKNEVASTYNEDDLKWL